MYKSIMVALKTKHNVCSALFWSLLCFSSLLPNQSHAQLWPFSPSKEIKLIRPSELALPIYYNHPIVGHSILNNSPQFNKLKLRNNQRGFSYQLQCDEEVTKAELVMTLDLGEDFTYGGNSFDVNLQFRVTAHKYVFIPIPIFPFFLPFYTVHKHYYVQPMHINEENPEQKVKIDITDSESFVVGYSFKRINYQATPILPFSNSPLVANDVRFSAEIKKQYRIRGQHINSAFSSNDHTTPLVTIHEAVPGNPMNLSWQCLCEMPLYQVQILRLRNNDPSRIIDERNIRATVDWNEALSFTTTQKHVSLTNMEGQGYYLWRVRPVGNWYEGTLSDSRNWGVWSHETAPSGGQVQYAGGHNNGHDYLFYYTDNADNKARVHSRQFWEVNDFNETVNYYSGLLNPRQTQMRQRSNNHVLLNHHLQDYIGRASMATLPAPIQKLETDYDEQFLMRGNNLYTADHFDTDDFYDDPQQITNGPLADYFSGAFADTTIPSAQGYPFSRSLLYQDGTGRVKETGMPGESMRVGGNHTSKTFIAGVNDDELIRVFGDETPSADKILKQITVDPNKVVTVEYVNDGKVVASCLSDGLDNGAIIDLPNPGSFSTTDTLSENQYWKPYGVHASKEMAFEIPTMLQLAYQLFPDTTGVECLNYCATCDYFISIILHNLDDPTQTIVVNLNKTAFQACPNGGAFLPYDTSLTYDLDPGRYNIETQVSANNPIPGTNGQEFYALYHPRQADSLAELMIKNALDNVFTAIDTADFEGLYDYLDIHAAWDGTDSIYTLSTPCCDFEIPHVECEPFTCPPSGPELWAYFQDNWDANYQSAYDGATVDGQGKLNAFMSFILAGDGVHNAFGEHTPYQWTDVNALAQAMLNDPLVPYTCEQIWSCWIGVTESAAFNIAQAGQEGIHYDPLGQLLNCTGKYFRGFTDGNSPSPNHNTHPYAYFYYDTVNNRNPECETLLFYNPSAPWPPDNDNPPSTPPGVPGYDPYENRKWEQLANCIYGQNIPEMGLYLLKDNLEAKCRSACELRASSFRVALVEAYQAEGSPVEGEDNPAGLVLPQISIAQIDCEVQMIMDYCMGNCNLTIFYRQPPGAQQLGPHTPSGQLVPGQLYKVEAAPGCHMVYNNQTYASTTPRGEYFFAGEETTYSASDGCTIGIGQDIQVLPDLSQIDSVGSLQEYNNMLKAMTGQFDITIPVGGNCTPGFELFAGDARSERGNNLVYNYDFEDVPCCPLPHKIPVSNCPPGWSASHGVPMVDMGDNLEHGQRVAYMKAYIDTVFGPTDTTIRSAGDGIYTYDNFYSGTVNDPWYLIDTVLSGEWYELTFEFKIEGYDTVKTRANLDALYFVLADTSFANDLSANDGPIVPTVNGIQVLFREGDLGNTHWEGRKKQFLADGDYNVLYIYPMQNRPDTAAVFVDNIKLKRMLLSGQCDSVCFKWKPVPQVPDSAIIPVYWVDCRDERAEFLTNYITTQAAACKEQLVQSMRDSYQNSCADAQNINDQLVISNDLGYHHYTLSYYDRSGNLSKTVSPAGVDNTALNRMQHPVHSFETKYRYNSFGQLIETNTPDGGNVKVWYNNLDQLRFSQTAQQLADGTYSFIKYDRLGRVIESGETTQDILTFYLDERIDDTTFPDILNLRISYTENHYSMDNHPVAYYFGMVNGRPQSNTRNRLSYTTNKYGFKRYYSYYPDGLLEWMIMDVPDVDNTSINDHQLKRLRYTYDHVTGQVKEIFYNEKEEDRFFTRYVYDEDGRMKEVYTSTDSVYWERETAYEYATNGTLKRREIGEDNLQGVDYVNTLWGWTKTINHPGLQQHDPGGDGLAGSANSHFAPDEFGMALSFFDDDFVRTGGSVFSNDHPLILTPTVNFFNGLIAANTSQTNYQAGNPFEKITAYTYNYDVLGRLKLAKTKHREGHHWMQSLSYNGFYNYDANGNLNGLDRYANNGVKMDDLDYQYLANTNKLRHIDDLVASASFPIDIDDQNMDNYNYDLDGRLVADAAEDILNIDWSASGKITEINRVLGGGEDLIFEYDDQDNRLSKKVLHTPGNTTTTHYVRDEKGSPLAIYKQQGDSTWLQEIPIYGDGRIGTYTRNQVVNSNPYGDLVCGPNGSVFTSPQQNNQVGFGTMVGAGEVDIEITIHTDNFGSETSWDLVNTVTSMTLETGGSYANNTTYFKTVTVPNGTEAEFTIYDLFGDGICCSQGFGFYLVVVNGDTVASGGNFTAYEATTFTVSNNTQYPAIYGNTLPAAKHQLLYTSAELQAAGVTAGTITRIGFDVAAVNGTSVYENFTIKMGCTQVTELTGMLTDVSTVVSPSNAYLNMGWNMYTLDTPYDWDGSSNLLIEVCFTNPGSSENSHTVNTETSFNSVVYDLSVGPTVCNSTNHWDIEKVRPNLVLRYAPLFYDGVKYIRSIGNRRYELNDHLGNTRVVISDVKLADRSGAEPEYSADVLNYAHYYPYGSAMPERQFETEHYRYGFNGKEKDDEIKGQGNSYDFHARLYDPRVGRWLSTDPMQSKFPAWSPYNFAVDNPVMFVDPDGESPISIFAKAVAKSGLKKAAKESIEKMIYIRLKAYMSKSWAKQLGKDALDAIDLATSTAWWEYVIEFIPIAGDAYGAKTLGEQGYNVYKIVQKFKSVGKWASKAAGKAWKRLGPNKLFGKGADKVATFSKKFNNQGSHLTESDLAGAVKEIYGLKSGVKANGTAYQHLKEVQDALGGMKTQMNSLKEQIRKGAFEGDALKSAQGIFNDVSKQYNEISNTMNSAKKAVKNL